MAAESDEEQIEQIKRWLEENGVSLVVTIVLALGGVFGYRAWENSVLETGQAASAVYDDLTSAVTVARGQPLSDVKLQTGKALSQELKDQYGGSTYSIFAALQMAKVYVGQGDLDSAEAELRWALENGATDSLEVITRIRLAKVLAEKEAYNEALAVLGKKMDLNAHKSTWEEVRGDVLYAKGDMTEAREAYQYAVNALDEGDNRPYLTMKLEDMTVVPSDDQDAEEEG